MGQVNVNNPGPAGPAEPVDGGGTGLGFIVGILLAIVIIALLVYFLVLNKPATGPANNGVTVPSPSAAMLRTFG
ncbi:MAG: hypothetical protein ACR2KI_00130 [Candidatus Limnocylindria bacterium]|nr:hypothetical protein [Chloroflexota bacterium]PZR61287.1 MAG: hypothetical protein DLM71_08985 [Chloroflexota bacterium]